MSKIEITDELLYEYCPKVDAYLLEQLPNDEEIDYVFSENFEIKMKKLIKEGRRPRFLNSIYAYSRKIAVFFITIIISACAITMSVEALRTQFFDLIKDIYEKFTIYQIRSKEDIDTVGAVLKKPQYMISGFNEVDKREDEESLFLAYSNDYDYITFSNFKLTDTNLYIDTENTHTTKVMVNNVEADYIVKDKDYKIIWKDSSNVYILTLEYLDYASVLNEKEELIKIAESLK